LLPAHLTVYYVLAMTLFSSSGYEEVMRSLTEGLAWTSDGEDEYELPSQVAITKARARLGQEPLALLFERACVPLATPATKGAFYRKWRAVSMDGTTIDAADTPANAEVLGRAGTGRGDGSAFPQLRIVAPGECAHTRSSPPSWTPLQWSSRPWRSGWCRPCSPGCCASRTADLLWRAKGNAVLPVLERHADGSFRSELVASDDKRRRVDVLSVRVIEYAINDPGRPSAWLVCAAMAFNLTRAAGALASVLHAKATTGTIRAQLINVPGRLARSARKTTLHLPTDWPWQTAWAQMADGARHGPPAVA